MKRAILFFATMTLPLAAAEAQMSRPSPAPNFRREPALSQHAVGLQDDRLVCLVVKRTGRQICRSYAYWRALNDRVAAKQARDSERD
jgi:hypothetical protein